MLPAAWDVTDIDLDSPESLYRLLKRELAHYKGSPRSADGPAGGI
jgi:hypothetical protein